MCCCRSRLFKISTAGLYAPAAINPVLPLDPSLGDLLEILGHENYHPNLTLETP
jgi:hypothetical protein